MGRILIVDDDLPTVSAMTTLLRQDGHEVEPCTSGPDAVVALRSGRTFDAVVTDFEMPVVDGGGVTMAARESSPDACIVVVHRRRADPTRLHNAGACLVLEKPIHYDDVVKLIAGCRAHGGHAGSQCARRFR